MKGYIFTYLLVVIGAVGAFRHPRIGLYIYLMFAVLRPQAMWSFAGNMQNLSWILGVATLLGWVLRGTGSWNIGKGKWAAAALVLFTLWCALSAIQAANTEYALLQTQEMLKILLPFIVGVTVLGNIKEARLLMLIIVLAQGYVALEMNRSYFSGYNRAHEDGYGGMDNNCLGVSLVATLGPALALALSPGKLWERIACLLSSALILHATMLTFSRGAMLGIVVSVLVAIVMMPKRPAYIAGVLLFGLLAIRLTGPQLLARYQSAFAEKEDLDYSAGSRVDLWKDCFTVAMQNPVFGIGLNNWPLIAHRFGWSFGKSAHSAWMQILAEVGFPGFAFLVFFYLFTVIRMIPVVRMRKTIGPGPPLLATGIMMSIAGYAVSAQFVSLQGLEIPYYVVMVAVVLLKGIYQPQTATVPVEGRVHPGSIALRPATAHHLKALKDVKA
jgi:O-antigen ligase